MRYDLLDGLDRLGVRWSITIPLYGHVKTAIAAIPRRGLGAHLLHRRRRSARRRDHPRRRRPRRTALPAPRRAPQPPHRPRKAELWPDWRYHAFVTNRDDLNTVDADAYHRQHATVELAIRDLKNSTGLAHLPSGCFAANAAWLTCATLAHNLYRWLAHHTGGRHNNKLTVGRTVRNQLLALPGRLVNHAGRTILRLPARWPWATTLPHHPHQHPQPPPTLLNPPASPTAATPHRVLTRPQPANTDEHTPGTGAAEHIAHKTASPDPRQPPPPPTNTHQPATSVDPG